MRRRSGFARPYIAVLSCLMRFTVSPRRPDQRTSPRPRRTDGVKRGIVWHSFAGLSGVIEVERNAFANGLNAVTCTYSFWNCQNYATYLRA